MSIEKTLTIHGVALAYHEVNTVTIGHTPQGTVISVTMIGWLSSQDKLDKQGAGGVCWTVQELTNCTDHANIAAVEAALITAGELQGGSVIPAPTPLTPLEYAKARKWTEIKNKREQAIAAPLTTPYGVFDADEQSQKRITDAIMLLQTLSAMGQPGTVNFILSDNTEATLDVTKMVEVGLLLGQRVQTCFNNGASLRSQIESATTVDQVEAIAWS